MPLTWCKCSKTLNPQPPHNYRGSDVAISAKGHAE